MKLSDLGEFGLIGLIKNAVSATRPPSSETFRRLLVDIGDDAAAWAGSAVVQLATTDCLVENVHFRFAWCSWDDLGYKSLAVNLSDVAAMGGIPRFALVSLSCPADVDSDAVMQYYAGMTRLAADHDTVIVGGNLTSSPVVTSTVCLIGEVGPTGMLVRGAARPGDTIAVTGSLGGAAAALSLLAAGADAAALSDDLKTLLTRPRARLSAARILAQERVRCAIDISDGLLSDLGHVCECSKVAAVVYADRLPLCPAYDGPAALRTAFALHGGEDYELLFTAEAATVSRIADRLDCPVTVIGEVIDRGCDMRIDVVGAAGAVLPAGKTGWSHFA